MQKQTKAETKGNLLKKSIHQELEKKKLNIQYNNTYISTGTS